jgi:mannosyl-3-phosphoglycerate phosphatase
LGNNDKGKVVEILKKLYKNQLFSIDSIGIGDHLNDIPMLCAVDHPIFLKGAEGHFPEQLSLIQNLSILEGTGPQAWNDAVLSLLRKLQL